MAMLKPKHVFPLYKGARAVFISGASQGNTWQNPRDQSQSGASSSSVCDDSRSDGQAQGQGVRELSPTLVRASSEASFDKKIAPPAHSVAALGVLGTSGLGRPPPSYVPVSEQLFKQGTVLPTGRGSAFLPDLTRQLHLVDSGAKQVEDVLVSKKCGSLSTCGGELLVAGGSVKGPVESRMVEGSGRFDTPNRLGQAFPYEPQISTDPGSAITASQLPPIPVAPSHLSLSILPQFESKSSPAFVSDNRKSNVNASLADLQTSSTHFVPAPFRNATSVSPTGNLVSPKNVQNSHLVSNDYNASCQGTGALSTSRTTNAKSSLSAKAVPWHPSPLGGHLQAQDIREMTGATKNTRPFEIVSKKGTLTLDAGGLQKVSSSPQLQGRSNGQGPSKPNTMGSSGSRLPDIGGSRAVRNKEVVVGKDVHIPTFNSQKVLQHRPSGDKQSANHMLEEMGSSVPRLNSSRKGRSRKIVTPLHAHPFHAVGETRRLPSHSVVVGNICQVLRKVKIHSQAFASGASPNLLERSDFFSAMKEWQNVVTAFHACDVLKQLDDPKIAMAFFNWAREQPQCKADSYVYTTMIGIMGRAKDTVAVGQLLQEMAKEGVRPTVVTYNRLIHSYGRANMIKEALACHAQMEEVGMTPDSVTHSTMIDLYTKAGMHAKAIEMYETMKAKGFVTDHVVRTMLMNSYGRLGDLPKVMDIFKEMSGSGNVPNAISWNTLIDVYGKAGKCSAALQFFQDMIEAGVKPDVLTYSTLIDICGKSGFLVQAEELFNRMLEEGHTADGIAWNTLVQIWGKAGQPKRAAKWFRRMLQAGISPTVPAFNTIIFSFLKGGLYEEAKLVFGLMQKRGCQPSLQTYTLLLSECTVASDQNLVNMLVDLMQASRHPVHGMIKVLLREPGSDSKQLWEDVDPFWGSILKEEQEPKRAFSDSLITFLYKCGFHARAGRVWEEARLRNIWPNAMLDQMQNDPGTWHLNLHYMSSGTAVVATRMELIFLKNKIKIEGDNSFPKIFEIITGKGNRSKIRGSSALKLEVVEFLAMVGSPFRPDPQNEGRLKACGSEAHKWLLTDERSDRLLLQDELMPIGELKL